MELTNLRTVAQLAREYQIFTEAAIRSHIRRKFYPVHRPTGRILIDITEFKAWLAKETKPYGTTI